MAAFEIRLNMKLLCVYVCVQVLDKVGTWMALFVSLLCGRPENESLIGADVQWPFCNKWPQYSPIPTLF